MDRLVLGRGEGCTVLKCVLLKISGLCVFIIDSLKKEKKKSEIKSNEFFFLKGVDNEDDDVNGSSGCIDVK